MPKNTNTNSMLRQWEMLKILPQSGSGISASQLLQILIDLGFNVSKRTVERDLLALAKVFDIECLKKSIPYGWRWKEDCIEELPEVNLTDAISLNLISETLKPLIPESMAEVLAIKLRKAREKLSENDESGWLSKMAYIPSGLQLQAPNIERNVLYNLQLSVIKENQIKVSYQSLMDNDVRELTLHPLAIILRGNVTYLIAKTNNYPDVILYAAHRFLKVKILEKNINRGNFNLQNYINSGAMQFGNPRPITISAKIDDVLFRLVSQTPISENQQIKKFDNGYYHLKVKMRKSWQLNWWILSMSEHIEILQPASFRQEIKSILSIALQKYT